ncbi:MAG: threonylcarbamoyl-AMP synthase [Candidatus Gastranaerophilales bacterium]|nr:threonylcarbamoyl-AMP synthase [Candidatus Gastranaerophilales bacterium]
MNGQKTILDKNSYISELNKILKNGGVIAFVTDTVWGIGCLPSSKKGVEKIYEIKGRDKTKPLILMSDKKENLIPYLNNISKSAITLMDKYFPGALTIVNEKSNLTPDYITSGKNTVGIRVPDNIFFQKLCSVIEGHVLATTSANLSNYPSSKNYEQTVNSIGSMVDIVFEDYGNCAKGIESTVVLTENDSCKILRQGCVILPEII